ncbi:unnamed protein product [Withania somnifera]
MTILFNPLLLLILLLSLTDLFASTLSLGIGINYGQIANNLPTPSRVSYLLRSLNVTRVKLYDADPNVLRAFANTDVEFVIGLGNEYLQRMSDPQQAQAWIEQHVQPYHTQTKITCITVGNEVLTGTDMQLKSYLLPAMQGVYRALVNLGLSNDIYVAHPHSAGILVHSAIKAMGHTDISVKVSETGWPSKGDPNEFGATPENAELYNGNLFQRIQQNQGTPAKPSEPIDVYVFALFNENLKPGPASERNYGHYYPDGTPVYDIGLRGFLPRMDYSAAKKNALSISAFLLLLMILLIHF